MLRLMTFNCNMRTFSFIVSRVRHYLLLPNCHKSIKFACLIDVIRKIFHRSYLLVQGIIEENIISFHSASAKSCRDGDYVWRVTSLYDLRRYERDRRHCLRCPHPKFRNFETQNIMWQWWNSIRTSRLLFPLFTTTSIWQYKFLL